MANVEVVGFGKSNESDFEKGFYVIKQKPKHTTTYQFTTPLVNTLREGHSRTVYVAKNEEEKKQLEQRLKEKFEAERKQREEKKRTGKGFVDFSKMKKP